MKQPAQKSKQVQTKNASKRREPRVVSTKRVLQISITLFGLFSFLFLGFYYGAVLKLAEGYSLFVYDYDSLTYINQSLWGIPYYIGRFQLQFYHYPLLGAALTTIVLLCCSALLSYGLKAVPKLRFLSIAIPSTFFLFLVYCGFGLFHLMEPSLPFVYLAGVFLLSLVTALVALTVRTLKKTAKSADDNGEVRLKQCIVPSLVLGSMAAAALIYPRIGMDIVTHSRMMNGVLEQKWDQVEEMADKLDHHTRSTAAYNAIALAHKGRLGDKLFKVSYRYPMQVTKTAGTFFHETMLYYSLCTYYSGLTHSAYYKAMEFATLNGFSPYALKLLTKCALLHGEKALAEKYLYILSQTTFHKDFVEKYLPYTQNEALIGSDPEFSKILSLAPISPLPFIQYYRDPIFIGYNIDLTSGRSLEALHLSLVSCLYGKMSNNFLERAQALDRKSILPYHYQEAIYLFSLMKNKSEFAAQFNISHQIKQNTLNFLKEYEKLKGDKFKARDLLEKNYLGMYAYYYFLENLPEESMKEKELYKKGVN